MFSKEETLKRIKDGIEDFQLLIDEGYNKKEIHQRLRLSRLEYDYLLTLKEDEHFSTNRYAFILAIESSTLGCSEAP